MADETRLTDFSIEAREELVADLSVTLSCTLPSRDQEEFPGRMPIYNVAADASWTDWKDEEVSPAEAVGIAALLMSLPHRDIGSGISTTIATAELALLSLHHRDTVEAADASSGYHQHVAGAILDPREGGLNEGLAEQLVSFGAYALDVAIVEVEDRFRGADVGLRMIARVIDHLAPMLSVVALHPFPVHASQNSEAENAAAHEKLAAYWGRLGFERYRGDIYTLDPNAKNDRLDRFL